MKKKTIAVCGYTMLIAVLVLGLAGWFIQQSGRLPSDWPITAQHWTIAAIVSGAAALVAAAFASVICAEYAERAWKAGKGHKLTLWLSVTYMAFCVGLEVAVAELGAHILGIPLPNPLILTAVLGFLAIAPRLVAFIKAGVEEIEREQIAKADQIDHERSIEHAQVRETAIANASAGRAGNVHRLGKVGAIGAAAALAGIGAMSAPPEQFPTETTAPKTTPGQFEAKRPGPVGPRVEYQSAELKMRTLMGNDPYSSRHSNAQLARMVRIGNTPVAIRTIRDWKRRWRDEIALAQTANAHLFDAA